MRKLLSIIAVCLLAGLACAATYSLPITFSGYTKTETLTNFPALVKFTNSISGFAYSQFASTNGYDLRFTNSAGTTELNYEIERWNTNGKSCVWVQVPLLTNGAFITAYWGDATKTTRQAYTTNGATWNNFKGVWHLPDGTTLSSTNSITNAFASVNYGATATNGMIDGAANFVGSSSNWFESNLIAVGSDLGLNLIYKNLTMEGWTYRANSGDHGAFFKLGNITGVSGGDGFAIGIGGTNSTGFETSGNRLLALYEGRRWIDTSLDVGTGWHHFALVVDPTGYPYVYWDGVKVYNDAGITALPIGSIGTSVAQIGGYLSTVPSSRYWTGKLDEIRVSNLDRSSNWVWACYMNQGSNTAFNSYGAVSGGTTGMSVWEQFARQLD